MNTESLHPTQKRRRRMVVIHLAVIGSLITAGAALAMVPAVRDHLCYEHRMNMFCAISRIGESEIHVFAWYPEVKPFDRTALAPRRILAEIPPHKQRSYASSFPSGTRQWLYWDARLTSGAAPGRPIKFLAQWTTYNAGGDTVAGGIIEATWGADDPTVRIVGPADNDPIRTVGQFPPGHYGLVLKVYGNQLAESEVRGGFDIY